MIVKELIDKLNKLSDEQKELEVVSYDSEYCQFYPITNVKVLKGGTEKYYRLIPVDYVELIDYIDEEGI